MTAVLRYDYDELGNLIKTIRPDLHEVVHLSYGSGHVYGIVLNQKDMIGFQRDDLHRETERYLANGLIQTNQYNDVGLLISQQIQPEQETQSPLDPSQHARQPHQAQRHYHYDKNYLLTQVEDSRLGKLNYQYDPIGRLIKSQSSQHTESFSFDPAGNLIDPIATQASQVKDNLIREYQGKRYSYDAQGNVIETQQGNKTLKLTWDNLNRLIQSDHNGRITQYGYDVFGRRLYKKSQDAKGRETLTLFGWDGDLMVWESKTVTDHKAQNNPQYNKDENHNKHDYTKHYVYEPNSFVPALQAGYSQFIKLIETPDYSQFKTMPYSIHRDPVWNTETRKNKAELERVMFYHCDQVGTPQSLSNELGECVWSIRQSTWGRAEEISQQDPDNPFEQTEIRFQGQYYDEETGLHYNRYRYYEPHSARYISKDPIGLQGGLNNSIYVSDPIHWIDPLGLMGEGTWSQLIKILANDEVYTPSGGTVQEVQSNVLTQACKNYSCDLPDILPDILICSGSFFSGSGNFGINLRNGNVYAGAGVSPDSIQRAISETIKPGSGGKGIISGGCLAYRIFGAPKKLENNRGELADAALDGISTGASFSYKGFAVGRDKPIFLKNGKLDPEMSSIVSYGAGLATPGLSVDFSGAKKVGNLMKWFK